MVSITISFRPPTKLFSVSPQAYFILLWCHKMEEGLEADNTIIKKRIILAHWNPAAAYIHTHSRIYAWEEHFRWLCRIPQSIKEFLFKLEWRNTIIFALLSIFFFLHWSLKFPFFRDSLFTPSLVSRQDFAYWNDQCWSVVHVFIKRRAQIKAGQ